MRTQLKRSLCQKFDHLDYNAMWLNDSDLRIVVNKSGKGVPLRFWKIFGKWTVLVGSEGNPDIKPLEKFVMWYLDGYEYRSWHGVALNEPAFT